MKRAFLLLADGSEEMESVIVADVLRRAGVELDIVSLEDLTVRCSRGVVIRADKRLADIETMSYDVMIMPGGMDGVAKLRSDSRVIEILRRFNAEQRLIAAICAAPLVLQEAGLLDGRRVTCYPGLADMLTATERREERVVLDGNFVTSQGPGTATEFGLQLVECLLDKDKSEEVAAGLVV